ncbi:MAG: FAD-binding oxidoreductase [Anaerolineae bacterium]|nr:FAD-binding oxidoreductase [Anaerolineae bacterium]
MSQDRLSSADVVIIGGGIQGLSLAYHLARRGVTDVCLLEMKELGSGSSGRSAAIVGYPFVSEKCLPLVDLSFHAWMRFEGEVGAEPGYEPIGCLVLAGPCEAPTLRRRHALLRQMGVDSALLVPDDIDRLTPGLNLSDIEVGLYNAREGGIDPHSIMMAYAAYARRQGVSLVEGVRAVGLEVTGGRVCGVRTTAGTIATGCVVNAAGFGARQVAAWVGLDLPISNRKRHIFCTGPVRAYAASIPFTYQVEPPWYMRREGPGLIIGMGSVESDEEDPQVDWGFLEAVIEQSLHRAPALEEAGVKSGWAGLRPLTPDDDPILGPVPHLAGFFNDCGWGGHGIMHAPGGGLLLSEWIVDGEPTSLDPTPFLVTRFLNAMDGL